MLRKAGYLFGTPCWCCVRMGVFIYLMHVHSYCIGWNYVTLKASMILLHNLWQRLCFSVVTYTTKCHQIFYFKEQKLISHSSEGWKTQHQCADRLKEWGRLTSWFKSRCLFTVTSQGVINHHPSGLFRNETNSNRGSKFFFMANPPVKDQPPNHYFIGQDFTINIRRAWTFTL